MRATKNSKTMPHRFSNSTLVKNSNKINIPVETNMTKQIRNSNSQKQSNNIITNGINNSQNEENFKEEEYNLELFNKKYIEKNSEEEFINNENKNQFQNIENEEEDNNIENDQNDDNELNKLKKDEKMILNNALDINYNNYIDIKNIEDEDNLNDNKYKENENHFNNIEIEEIEIDDNNEKYNLPLAMYNNIKEKKEDKNNELVNNLEIIQNDDKDKQEKELIDNDEKIINDNVLLNKEKEHGIIDISKKENIDNDFVNENDSNIQLIKKSKNPITENYEDYILNTLAKLKKNQLIKPNKKINKTFNLSSNNIKKELNKNNSSNNISNSMPKLVKSNKTVIPINTLLDINNTKNKNSLHISPINNSCSMTKKIDKEEINSYKEDGDKNLEIPEDAKFGIDETGNPLSISQILDEEKNEKKKVIAFIMQKNDDENNKINYLVDKKGKILEKSKEGDYFYKQGDTYVVIKDFDVQHPELRVYGHRSYTPSENKIISEKVTIDNNVEEIKNNIYINNKEDNKPNQIINKTETNEISDKNFVLNLKEKHHNNIINSTDDLKNLLLNNSNNHSFIKKNINNNIHKKNKYYRRGNEEINKLMAIWRKRYGEKDNMTHNLQKKLSNYSYTVRHEDRLVERTNSILKMASERGKKNISFTTESNNNLSQISFTKHYPKLTITKKYNIPVYSNQYINKKYQNPLLKKYNSSLSKNINNNPLLKNKNILLRNNINEIPSIKMNTDNLMYKKDITKNKIFEYINKERKDKINQISNNLIKNIIQKNKEQKGQNFETNKDKGKISIINDYIYKNIKQINNKKKNLNKYSILSFEANKAIKDFANNQKRKNKLMINKKNILINNSLNNRNINANTFTNSQNKSNDYLSNNIINKKDNKLKSTSFGNIRNNRTNAVLNPDIFKGKNNINGYLDNFNFNRNKVYK